jgi:carbon storage regulator
MLVLTRKKSETIFIDDNIEVKVLAINGNEVKLGFSAPRRVTIRRQELMSTPRQQNPIVGKQPAPPALCSALAVY